MAKKQEDKSLDTFQWVGVSARGKKLQGELTGSSVALVKAQLRKQGMVSPHQKLSASLSHYLAYKVFKKLLLKILH